MSIAANSVLWFRSTPPRRRRRHRRVPPARGQKVSIHASAQEATAQLEATAVGGDVSIHAPPQATTWNSRPRAGRQRVSLHDSPVAPTAELWYIPPGLRGAHLHT